MLLTLTTNCCTRLVNLHSSFFEKPDLFNEKVKKLSQDLAIGQKIKHVTVERDGIEVYSFSSGQLKDSEKHSLETPGNPADGRKAVSHVPVFVKGSHLQKAEKINFMRS